MRIELRWTKVWPIAALVLAVGLPTLGQDAPKAATADANAEDISKMPFMNPGLGPVERPAT
jgi:hypothetical protein